MRSSLHPRSSRQAVSLRVGLVWFFALAIPAAPAHPQPRRLTQQSWQATAWDTVFKRLDTEATFQHLHWGDSTTLVAARVRFSRTAVDVPEFDDQQRLPKSCDAACTPADYEGLATIFPTDYLDRWTIIDFKNRKLAGIPVAEICSELDYTLLGIHKTVDATKKCDDPNTLFIVYAAGEWRAYMRPPSSVGGPAAMLSVERTNFATDRFCKNNPTCRDSVPPVARFDWVRKTPVIGVRCADGWCDVMPDDNYTGTPDTPGNSDSPSRERVKGWHDRQHLMAGNKPLGPFLEVIPVDSLASIELDSFAARWVPVAYIAKPMDYKKLPDNTYMVRGGNIRRNEVQIRGSGTNWEWRMRYVYANGDSTFSTPRKAEWTPHMTTYTPATARWRWMENDEMIWTRCANGCCQLKPL